MISKKVCRFQVTCPSKNYPQPYCQNDQQYIFSKYKCGIRKQLAYPRGNDLLSCCTGNKNINCGLATPDSDTCRNYMKDYCSANFDNNCKKMCSVSNSPNWCETIAEDQCQVNPQGEVCNFFCGVNSSYPFCPEKPIPQYQGKQYSYLFYIACVISVLVLFLLLL